jgi:hypothetical protein
MFSNSAKTKKERNIGGNLRTRKNLCLQKLCQKLLQLSVKFLDKGVFAKKKKINMKSSELK